MTLTVIIDEAACAAHGDCVDVAPEVFVLDDVARVVRDRSPTMCCWRPRKRARAPQSSSATRRPGTTSIRDSVVALVAAVPVMPGHGAHSPSKGQRNARSRAVLEAGGVAAAVAAERGGVAGPVGIAVGGGVAVEGAGLWAALVPRDGGAWPPGGARAVVAVAGRRAGRRRGDVGRQTGRNRERL